MHWLSMPGQFFLVVVESVAMLRKIQMKAEMRKEAQAAEDFNMLKMQHLVGKVCEEIGMA